MKSPVGLEKALELFYEVAHSSPAYQAFLKEHHVSVSDIASIDDFEKIPVMDRHNYINRYPLQDRLYGGKTLADFYMISGSSGSTGEPTYWPRDHAADTLLEVKKEAFYEEHFQISKKKTLCVIAFALGVWTGGMLTAKLSWAAGAKHKITVVTPGMNKAETLAFIQKLSPFYDQVILLGYPPFLLDFVEYVQEKKYDLRQAHVKIMTTGERVSERWRNHIAKYTSDANSRYDVVDFYACSDTGIIGTESKFCIELLHHAFENSSFCNALFGVSDPPTFVKYDPNIKFLEEINSEIHITARQPMPLIRYNIHDRGKLLDEKTIQTMVKNHAIQISHHADKGHYVCIFGRSDAVLLAANIYIEDIRYCIENSSLKEKFTGNFKYGREETQDLRLRLKLHVFLKEGSNITTDEKKEFTHEFITNLRKVNHDFNLIFTTTKMEEPLITFIEDDPKRFTKTKLKYFL